MGWYLFIFIAIIVLMLAKNLLAYSGRCANTLIFQFSIMLLCFFACFRGSTVGKDTHSYMRIFTKISRISWKEIFSYSNETGNEIGYVIYNKVLSIITVNSHVITIANGLLLIYFLYRLLKKLTDPMFCVYLFITLGLFQAGFNIVVSMIASFIVFDAVDYIEERNFKAFLIRVLIASLFHRAAWILLALYFIGNIKITAKRLIAILGCWMAISRIYTAILPLMMQIVPLQYRIYLERSESDNGIILIFHMLILICIFIVQYSSDRNIQANNQMKSIRIYLWGVIIEVGAFLFSLNAVVFSRVAYMFTPALMIYIPLAVESISYQKNKKILRYGLLLAIGIQYILRLNINNIGESMPYTFFFE